jgi:hypothetical protein
MQEGKPAKKPIFSEFLSEKRIGSGQLSMFLGMYETSEFGRVVETIAHRRS